MQHFSLLLSVVHHFTSHVAPVPVVPTAALLVDPVLAVPPVAVLVARVLVVSPAVVLVACALVPTGGPAPLVLATAVHAPGPFSKTLACAGKVHDVPFSDPAAYGLATLHITSPPNKRRNWRESIVDDTINSLLITVSNSRHCSIAGARMRHLSYQK